MEAFNLLKFWRHGGGDNISAVSAASSGDVISEIDYVNSDYHKTPITTSVNTDVRNRAPEFYGGDTDDDGDGDGDSFFDLEFTSLECRNNKQLKNCSKFLESPTDVFRSDSKPQPQPQSPIAILRSPKFKVLMLRFKKSKTENTDSAVDSKKERRKSFEEAPIISRDNSLRTKMMREILEESNVSFISKKSEKDLKKYLRLIKPLYTVASKRYSRSSNKFSAVSPMCSPATTAACASPRRRSDEKFSGLKVVYKHLGKSRSASSALAGAPPSPVKRRDDSLVLHNDGIQSAILHCKRSYNSSSKEFSRCSSDLLELKRCSI